MGVHAQAQALKEAWNRFAQTVARPPACLKCNGKKVWWDGRRERTASVRLGEQTVHLTGICCRRARCADAACGFRWCLLPPGLAARRHYQACVVSAAAQEYLHDERASLQSTAERHGCSRRTLGRWLAWLGGLTQPAVIQERIPEIEGDPIVVPQLEVAALARKARIEARRLLLKAAAAVLAHVEALAMALGLEPPALSSVLESEAPLGARQATQAQPRIPELARRRTP